MSGGFFRGTSADQDTRFSNKQAKLLKSQKFSPELEHLVDMTKVKMDVMKPWIGRRVTELLGFEDEVLINFIYSLLEGKAVNGKEVQIQLTGFMEKNTGKFMKELWTLLLSAQQTASGVPQQFLDAKAEELQKKEADDRRILNKIEKRMDEESKELQMERSKKMDNGVEEKKATNFDMELGSGRTKPKDLSSHTGDDKVVDKRNGTRGRSRFSRSPPSAERSRSPPRVRRSISHSRSYSGRRDSRSVSASPVSRRRSISLDQANRSSRRQSNTPRAMHSPRISLSPSRRRTYSRHRSRSPSSSRSPSPAPRRVSSYRHRSPSPIRHRRSLSPGRHPRSPSPSRRRRSPSPARRRRSPSPSRRRRSPSPGRRRISPSLGRHRRSPSPSRRHRSPSIGHRRRSPSPSRRHRSPMPSWLHRSRSSGRHGRLVSPVRRRRSPSPARRPIRSPSPSNLHPRSPSPRRGRSRSPLYSRRRDASPPARGMSSPTSPRRYSRSPLSSHSRSVSPVQRSPAVAQRLQEPQKRSSFSRLSSSPPPRKRSSSPPSRKYQGDYKVSRAQTMKEKVRLRSSLLRDSKDQKDIYREVPPLLSSPEASPQQLKSPRLTRRRSLSEETRSLSPHNVPLRQRQEHQVDDGNLTPQRARELNARNSSPDTSKDEEAEYIKKRKEYKSGSSQKLSSHSPVKNKQKDSPVRVSNKNDRPFERSDGPGRHSGKIEKPSGRSAGSGSSDGQMSPTLSYKSEEKQHESNKAGKKLDEMQRGSDIWQHESATTKVLVQKADHKNGSGDLYSDSDGTGKLRTERKEKKKHKRSHRRELASDDESDDSEIEDRKEAKRRRKEEKKMRKEEKRRRREERRRRKEERRAEKQKLKDQSDAYSSDEAFEGRRDNHQSNKVEDRDEQKKLEIELRNKALELYKAKKGISH